MRVGPPYRELTGLDCLVPSGPFSRAPEAIRHAHLCQFWYGPRKRPAGLFLRLPHPTSAQRPGRFTVPLRYGNPSPAINLREGAGILTKLSIDYAFRPRLRIRLTLGGITFPRKPWAYGDADSHCINRYSIWHIHLLPLHQPLRENFDADSNALLPTHTSPTASVSCLSPIIIGARILDQ